MVIGFVWIEHTQKNVLETNGGNYLILMAVENVIELLLWIKD